MYYNSSSYDPSYLPIILALFIISLIVQGVVNKRYKKYAVIRPVSGLTGMQAAQKLLYSKGVNVQFGLSGRRNLSDYYSPKEECIYLSEDTSSSSSVAAIGVACHEAGHALQYAENYFPVKIRMSILPICNIGSKLAIPIMIIGFILMGFSLKFQIVAMIGVALFGLTLLFQLVTLPVEFNASRRAIVGIRELNMLTEEELVGVKKILSAAAMTYVISMLMTLVQFMRLLSIVRRR